MKLLAIVLATLIPLTGAGSPTPPTGVAAYVGPGDVVAGAIVFQGLRAYSNTLANAGASTTKVIDVLGSTTSTGCTIFLLGAGTGGLDTTTAGAGSVGNQCLLGATHFCTVTNVSCSVSKIYDQTGNGNNGIQATAANQPTLTFSCTGALPCLTFFTESSQFLDVSSFSTTQAQPFTIYESYENTASGDQAVPLYQPDTGQTIAFIIDLGGNANLTGYVCGSNQTAAATDNVFHAVAGVCNGASGILGVDGVSTTVNAGTATLAATEDYTYGAVFSGGPSQAMTGKSQENGVWPSGWSTGQITSECRNTQAYYGAGSYGTAC